MQDYSELLASHGKELQYLLELAETRNFMRDDQGTVWCPVSVNLDAPGLKGAGGASFFFFLVHLYFPRQDLSMLSLLVSQLAASVLEFPDNGWLLSAFERYASSRYNEIYKKNSSECLPEELASFNLYDHGTPALSSKGVVAELAKFDYFQIPAKDFESYIYVPTSTEKYATVPLVGLPRSGASGSVHRVNQQDLRHFLYVDVGAWSSPQNISAGGSAAFCMISTDEIALWDLMAPVTLEHRPPRGKATLVSEFLQSCGRGLPGDMVFYARFFGDRFEVYHHGIPSRYWWRIPIPFTSETVMFLIPDLHLHMFPQSAADNFVEPGPARGSLVSDLLALFDRITAYSRNHPVDLYQVGDCYELWESALLLCFAGGQGPGDLFSSIGATTSLAQAFVEGLRDKLRQDITDRNLDEIFTAHDVNRLAHDSWDQDDMKPIWLKMKEAIESVQVATENGRRLFTPEGRINADLSNWTIIGGNHDSFVTDVTPLRRGINNAVFIEHGHLRDDKNGPTHMFNGVFWTGLGTAAELKGVGDEAKNVETSRRDAFLKNAADVNFKPDYEFRKPSGSGPDHYSIVATGHTHHQYVALLREHQSLPAKFETVAAFHEEPWPEGFWNRAVAVTNRRLFPHFFDPLRRPPFSDWATDTVKRTIERFARTIR